jgi:hypothetical protein
MVFVAAESCESLNHKNPDSDKDDDLEYAPIFRVSRHRRKKRGREAKKIW